jgi:hypothetical protein
MKERIINIKLTELIATDRAITTEKGGILFDVLEKNLSEKNVIVIDFSNLELLISAFLNVGIGQLYSKFDSEFIDHHLRITNISDDDKVTYELVVTRAKQYFKDRQQFENSANPHFPDA